MRMLILGAALCFGLTIAASGGGTMTTGGHGDVTYVLSCSDGSSVSDGGCPGVQPG